MNIIFSVGSIEKNLNANTKIVLTVADKMSQKGHKCYVTGVCSDTSGDITTEKGTVIKRFPQIKPIVKSSRLLEKLANQTGDIGKARSLMIKKHPLSAVMLFVKYHPFYKNKVEIPRYIKQVKEFAENIKPDGIICVCKPVDDTKAVMENITGYKKYIWQLDPWGMHRLDNKGRENEAISAELSAFDKAEHVFSTPILIKQYSEKEEYGEYLKKISPLEFPNIQPYIPQNIKSPIDFDGGYINMLFCGTISDEYRSPEKLLESLSVLIDSGEKIKIYFVGTGESISLNKYIEKYPDNIFSHGQVSSRQAFRMMEKADILVNISNSVDNQVPSKIFDYFSMCKPIINLQKSENCPAREYFDKYPLAYTVEDFAKRDNDKLKEFIIGAKNKTVSYRQIETIYQKATADYVARQIEAVLSESIQRNDNI